MRARFIKGDPPPSARRTSIREPVLAELKAKPGVWAIVEERVPPSRAHMWRMEGCEAVARRPTPSEPYQIYARWPAPEPQ